MASTAAPPCNQPGTRDRIAASREHAGACTAPEPRRPRAQQRGGPDTADRPHAPAAASEDQPLTTGPAAHPNGRTPVTCPRQHAKGAVTRS
jgi:hypothetical protein